MVGLPQAVAVLFAAAAISSAVNAADYQLVAGNHNQISLIDREAIAKMADGLLMAPVVGIRREANTANYSFGYIVVDTVFDCDQRRLKSISVALFDRDGTPSKTQPPPPSRKPGWITPQPLSQGEDTLSFVCGTPVQHTAARPLRGLSLVQIVAAAFAGPWPGDAKTRDPGAKPAP